MLKKSFIIFFVLIFICSMTSIVAFAEVDYNDINTTVDLLKADSYSISGFASGDGESINEVAAHGTSGSPIVDYIYEYFPDNGETIVYHYSELQLVNISWSPVIKAPISKLYFYFTQSPNNTEIYINGISHDLNFSDQTSSYSAYYTTFSIPTYIEEINITMNAPSSNNGSTFTSPPGIISCFGFNMIQENFSRAVVNAYNSVWNYDSDELLNVDKDYFFLDWSITPGLNTGSIVYGNDFYQQGATGVLLTTVEISIDLQELGPDYLNFFKMDYSLLGEIREVSSWVGSDYYDAHDYLTSLSVNNIYSDSSIFEFAFDDAEIHTVDADNYSLFINLNGIDLKPYRYLNITITFEPVDADRDYGTLSFLNLNRLSGFYSIAYDSSETIILSTISSLLMNSNNIYSALLAIQDYFTVNENQADDVTDKSDSVSSQAGSLNDGINQLEQVDRPDINFGSLLSNSGFQIGAAPTNILSVVTYNKYILPLLLIVFTLALAAYLLFGKR